jgi:hypothetical protein
MIPSLLFCLNVHRQKEKKALKNALQPKDLKRVRKILKLLPQERK